MLGPYMCSTSHVRQKLVHCSCVCHGLEARLCILLPILDLLWRELFFDFPFFIGEGLGLAWLWVSPLSTHSLLLPKSCCCSCHTILLFLPWYYLTCAYWASFRPVAYSSLNDPIWSLDLYSCYFKLFLTHYIACGLLCPISFFLGIFGPSTFLGHPWPIF